MLHAIILTTLGARRVRHADLSQKGKGRSSFLKKRSKKLLLIMGNTGVSALNAKLDAFAKVFWFFFSKKNTFLNGL
jgi:hypothetical protein